MTLDARIWLGVAGLAVLACAVVSLAVILDRRLRDIEETQRRIHLQQANIISMLLRAGFRAPRSAPDWGDSGHWTSIRE